MPQPLSDIWLAVTVLLEPTKYMPLSLLSEIVLANTTEYDEPNPMPLVLFLIVFPEITFE